MKAFVSHPVVNIFVCKCDNCDACTHYSVGLVMLAPINTSGRKAEFLRDEIFANFVGDTVYCFL